MSSALFLFLFLPLAIWAMMAMLRARTALTSPADAPELTSGTGLGEGFKAVDEDITTFGEELRTLDLDVVGVELDQAASQDYQRALDAYEHAKESLAQVRHPAQLSQVTEILEDGRYSIACVKARAEGRPLPSKRPPCFFNPAHGPSAVDVEWAPPGGSPRKVPACAADAERVMAGAEPHVRTVAVGAGRVPYWTSEEFGPYVRGYFHHWGRGEGLPGVSVGMAAFAGLGLGALLSELGSLLDD